MIRNSPIFSIFKHGVYNNYLWVLYNLLSTCKSIYSRFSPKAILKKEEVDYTKLYIDNKKTRFLNTFTPSYVSEEMNSSIHSCFYSKKEFNEVLMDTDNKIEKEWKTRILFENTPRGNIIMFYDIFKQGFSYYSDTTSIPYSILNSVAMKYVLIYKCRDFFIDDEITPVGEPSPMIKIHSEEPKKVEKEKVKKQEGKSFVKFKNYTKNISSVPEKEYSRNRFINLGKTTNFNFIQSTPKKKIGGFTSKLTDMLVRETNVQMNYSEFKRSIMLKI